MANKNLLDEISDKVASLLPKAEALGSEMKDELNAKIQNAIKSSLESLDIVTREEFNAQAAMLARAEAKVADLEARVTELTSKET
ncbi:MAG: accessory factor UbiK family protein [Pseudohongiellaceae bacterium]